MYELSKYATLLSWSLKKSVRASRPSAPRVSGRRTQRRVAHACLEVTTAEYKRSTCTELNNSANSINVRTRVSLPFLSESGDGSSSGG